VTQVMYRWMKPLMVNHHTINSLAAWFDAGTPKKKSNAGDKTGGIWNNLSASVMGVF